SSLNLIRLLTSLLLIPALSWAQHRVSIRATYDESSHSFTVDQQLTYRNQSDDPLRHLIVNDWNNAYSSKTTPLAERFSDEFKRAFYYAREEERGFTDISHIISGGKSLQWKRPDGHPDLVSIQTDALFPGDSVMLFLR